MKSKLYLLGAITLGSALTLGCGHHNSEADADVYTMRVAEPAAQRVDAPSAPTTPSVSTGGDVEITKPSSNAPSKTDVRPPPPDTPLVPVPVPASEVPKIAPDTPAPEPSVKPIAPVPAPLVKDPSEPSIKDTPEPSVKAEPPTVNAPATQPGGGKTDSSAGEPSVKDPGNE